MKAGITAREKQRDLLYAEAAVILHDDQRQALGRRAHEIHVEATVARTVLDRLVRDLVNDVQFHFLFYAYRTAARCIPLCYTQIISDFTTG